jgi:magnesium-transporting ATPase (P-type)
MGATTLGVLWWGSDHRDDVVARTMAMTTFAAANLFFSFETRDELRSAFDLEVLEDRKFLIASGVSVVSILLGPQLSLFQRMLDTVPLTLREWLVCVALGLTVIVFVEIQKFFLRRSVAAQGGAAPAEAAAAA